MELTLLEQDLLGELAQDDHGIVEVFLFVHQHHPELEDTEVAVRARDLLTTWIDRGWLAIAPTPLGPPGLETIAELRRFLHLTRDEQGDDRLALTWVRLAPSAYNDVPWIAR